MPRLILLAALLAATATDLHAQSSNSSSNCSNGHCTRVESHRDDDSHRPRAWTRFEAWAEGRDGGRDRRHWRDAHDDDRAERRPVRRPDRDGDRGRDDD